MSLPAKIKIFAIIKKSFPGERDRTCRQVLFIALVFATLPPGPPCCPSAIDTFMGSQIPKLFLLGISGQDEKQVPEFELVITI